MKQQAMFIALAFAMAAAQADVYKCDNGSGRMEYSQKPCAANAKVVKSTDKGPSEDDVKAAQARMASENDTADAAKKVRLDKEKEKEKEKEAQAQAQAQAGGVLVMTRTTTTTTTVTPTANQAGPSSSSSKSSAGRAPQGH